MILRARDVVVQVGNRFSIPVGGIYSTVGKAADVEAALSEGLVCVMTARPKVRTAIPEPVSHYFVTHVPGLSQSMNLEWVRGRKGIR